MSNGSDFFYDIPEEARHSLNIPKGLSEDEVLRIFSEKAEMNTTVSGKASFLGGEFQPRYIPAALRHIMSMGELLTAYTSYQPEVSQGMLQGLFEYQSLMAELTQMDVVNASLYDGATGLGEALRLSSRATRKKRFLLPEAMCPAKKQIAELYVKGFDGEIEFYGHEIEGGGVNISDLRNKVSEEVAGVYVEMPNALGVLDEQIFDMKEQIGGALLLVGVDPLSLAILRAPGDYGADIVIGEGQPLGLPIGYGGPTLGLLGVTKKLVRKMPGRVVGATEGTAGERAFCITLQTREQHIRREKATSNICSNEAHCAIVAGAYMALQGASGLKRLAGLLTERAHRLAEEMNKAEGFKAPLFSRPFFNSFAVETPIPYSRIEEHLLKNKIQGGQSLSPLFQGEGAKDNIALFSVNETIPDEAYTRLVRVLHEIEGWGG